MSRYPHTQNGFVGELGVPCSSRTHSKAGQPLSPLPQLPTDERWGGGSHRGYDWLLEGVTACLAWAANGDTVPRCVGTGLVSPAGAPAPRLCRHGFYSVLVGRSFLPRFLLPPLSQGCVLVAGRCATENLSERQAPTACPSSQADGSHDLCLNHSP